MKPHCSPNTLLVAGLALCWSSAASAQAAPATEATTEVTTEATAETGNEEAQEQAWRLFGEALDAERAGDSERALALCAEAVAVAPGLQSADAQQLRVVIAEARGDLSTAKAWIDEYLLVEGLGDAERAWGARLRLRLTFYQGHAEAYTVDALNEVRDNTIKVIEASNERLRNDEKEWLNWANRMVGLRVLELGCEVEPAKAYAVDMVRDEEFATYSEHQQQLVRDAEARLSVMDAQACKAALEAWPWRLELGLLVGVNDRQRIEQAAASARHAPHFAPGLHLAARTRIWGPLAASGDISALQPIGSDPVLRIPQLDGALGVGWWNRWLLVTIGAGVATSTSLADEAAADVDGDASEQAFYSFLPTYPQLSWAVRLPMSSGFIQQAELRGDVMTFPVPRSGAQSPPVFAGLGVSGMHEWRELRLYGGLDARYARVWARDVEHPDNSPHVAQRWSVAAELGVSFGSGTSEWSR